METARFRWGIRQNSISENYIIIDKNLTDCMKLNKYIKINIDRKR